MSILRDRSIPTAEPTATTICRKCGVTVTDANRGSVSPEGKATCADCLAASLGIANEVTVVAPQQSLADAVERNSKPIAVKTPAAKTAAPAPAKKPAEKPAAKASKKPAPAPAPTAPVTEKQAEAQRVWDAVVALLDAGEGRTQIAAKVGVPYSTVTRIIWFRKYGVDAMPGMVTFSQEKMNAAQQVYLKDVQANKDAKSDEKAAKAAAEKAAAQKQAAKK